MADELHLYRQAIQEAHAIAKAYPSLKNGQERLQNYLQEIDMPAKNYRSLKEDLEPVAIRLPLSTIAYIDGTILPTLQAQTPWAKVGRSDAVRYLVQIGIDAGFAAEALPTAAATAAATTAAVAPAAAAEAPAAVAATAPAVLEPGAVVQEPPPFDTEKYKLGKLCKKNHNYAGTGQSLRKISNSGCVACDNARRSSKTAAG